MAYLPLTKSKHLLPFTAILKTHGVRVHGLLRSANLPLTCLDDPDTFIPAVCAGPFRELVAKKTGFPNISLEVTQDLDFETMGDFGRALVMEPTLYATLDKFRQLVATETSNVVIDLHPLSSGDLWFGQRMLSDAGSGEWHSNLYVIIWMLKIVQLAIPEWSPTEIMITSKATRERCEAIEGLGSTACFEKAGTGFLIPASMLALPIAKNPVPGKNTDATFRPTTPAATYAEAIKQTIHSYATDDWLSIEQLGEVHDTSVRTLQRRLSTEKKTYSRLIQQCRAETAGDLLENTDLAIADIAQRLGYGSQGNFTRAFYGWAKVSPSTFRKQRLLTIREKN